MSGLFQGFYSDQVHLLSLPKSYPVVHLCQICLTVWRRIQIPVNQIPTSKMELFAKLVNNWKLLHFFSKSSIRDIWQGSEYASAEWKVNCFARFCNILQSKITCIFCHFSTVIPRLETLSLLVFSDPSTQPWIMGVYFN